MKLMIFGMIRVRSRYLRIASKLEPAFQMGVPLPGFLSAAVPRMLLRKIFNYNKGIATRKIVCYTLQKFRNGFARKEVCYDFRENEWIS
jgi:hypothetical protein